MNIFSVVNHPPDSIYMFLKSNNRKSEIVTDKLDEGYLKPSKTILLFANKETFITNITVAEKRTCIVFCSPVYAYEHSLPMLDCTITYPLYESGMKLEKVTKTLIPRLDRLTKKNEKQVVKKQRDILVDVLESVQKIDSFLNPFMSFIYTTPSATHQKPLKEQILLWMYNNESEKQLNERLKSLGKNNVYLSNKQQKNMSRILFSETSMKYREALSTIKNIENPHEMELAVCEASKTMALSAYDLRYILSVVSKIHDVQGNINA